MHVNGAKWDSTFLIVYSVVVNIARSKLAAEACLLGWPLG